LLLSFTSKTKNKTSILNSEKSEVGGSIWWGGLYER